MSIRNRIVKGLRASSSLTIAAVMSLVLLAPRAHAQEDRSPLQPADAQPSCVFYDSCTWDTGGTGGGGGNYSYCLARGSLDQRCQDVVTIYNENTVCATGCQMCASVKYSAGCQCDDEQKKTKGSCTYW